VLAVETTSTTQQVSQYVVKTKKQDPGKIFIAGATKTAITLK